MIIRDITRLIVLLIGKDLANMAVMAVFAGFFMFWKFAINFILCLLNCGTIKRIGGMKVC